MGGSPKKQWRSQKPGTVSLPEPQTSHTVQGKGRRMARGRDPSSQRCFLWERSGAPQGPPPPDSAIADKATTLPQVGRSTWHPSGRNEGRKHLYGFLNLPHSSPPHSPWFSIHLGSNIKCLHTSKTGTCIQRGMHQVQEWLSSWNGMDLVVRLVLRDSR